MKKFVAESDRSFCDPYSYSSAVAFGGQVILSGVIGRTPEDKKFEEPEEEFRDAWRRIQEILESMDSELTSIVDLQTFHFDQSSDVMRCFIKIKKEVLGDTDPAWTGVGALGPAVRGARAEIRVTAIQSVNVT